MTVLRPYQVRAIEGVKRAWLGGARRILLVSPTGCHARGQRVLTNDGSTKRVEDVVVGDQLMGLRSEPRSVLSLCRGVGEMYRIIPIKGAPFVVNDGHVLSLVETESGDVVDVTVREWIGWSKWRKHTHKLFRSPADFDRREKLPIDPYFLGVLLGDGSMVSGLSVCKPDIEIQNEVRAQATACGLSIRLDGQGTSTSLYMTSGTGGPAHRNPMIESLRSLGLYGRNSETKFVPRAYRCAFRPDRLSILAGLLDTDGSLRIGGYDFVSKSHELAADVAFIARSLGLAAYVHECEKASQNGTKGTYHRVSISGDCSVIPCRIQRKKAPPRRQKKDVLRTGFTIEAVGVDDYFGFTLDGDGRYLLEDFTVTHNSGKTAMGVGIVEGAVSKGRRVLWLAHRRELISQASERLDSIGCVHHGVVLAGHTRNNPLFPIQVASVQTITARGNAPPADILVWDEAHHCTAATYRDIAAAYPSATHFGLTATPERGDQSPLGDVFQSMVVAASIRELISQGHLVRVSVFAPEKPTRDLSEDPVELYKTHARGRRCIVFAASLVHARGLALRFTAEGFPAECVEGTTPSEVRENALRRLATGSLRVVVNVFCLTEGTDVPAVDCILIARGCSAWSAWIQMGGRGLRPAPGKRDLVLLDPRGHVHAHGMLDDERVFSLEGKASKALGTLQALRQCRACGATYRSAPTCPRCGATSPPPEPPKVNARPVAQVTAAQVAPWSERRAYFDALVRRQQEAGFDPRWVGIQYKQKYFSWPVWPIPR